ncbi:DMT family transporter [Candidatus Parcubacteria bacterium]|nr:DMT family transporter [Candidatus Parcubacteria bacterium]
MNAFLPIIAAVLQAGSFTLDKVVLSFRRVTQSTYLGVSFPLIFAITLLIFLALRPPLDMQFFAGRLGWLLAASIALIVLNNFIFYRALDHDGLAELETIGLISKVPTILLAGVVFVDERNFSLIIPALIAALAIVWSHWEKRHFQLARDTRPVLLWSLVAAPIAAVVSKELLSVWHPVSLELVRSGAAALVLGPLYVNAVRQVSGRAFGLLVLTNILTTVAWILFFFSYQRLGIVHTLLLFSVQPLLVYLAAIVFLRERFSWRKTVAFFVILAAIAAAQVLRS